MSVNPGIWVRQAIASAPRSFEKYANVALERWSFQEMIDVWSEVTGRKGRFIQCTIEEYKQVWGLAGYELGLQFRYGERCDPWEVNDSFISPEELGIDKNEVVGFRGTIEGLKHLM